MGVRPARGSSGGGVGGEVNLPPWNGLKNDRPVGSTDFGSLFGGRLGAFWLLFGFLGTPWDLFGHSGGLPRDSFAETYFCIGVWDGFFSPSPCRRDAEKVMQKRRKPTHDAQKTHRRNAVRRGRGHNKSERILGVCHFVLPESMNCDSDLSHRGGGDRVNASYLTSC